MILRSINLVPKNFITYVIKGDQLLPFTKISLAINMEDTQPSLGIDRMTNNMSMMKMHLYLVLI